MNTTISVKINKDQLFCLNNVIKRYAVDYLQHLSRTQRSGSQYLFLKTTDSNLANFWRKISLKILVLNNTNSGKNISFSINLNHWLAYSDMLILFKPDDAYVKVVYSDIQYQIHKKIELQPITFIAQFLA